MIDIQKERTACELSMADGDMECHKFLQKIFTFNEEVSGGKERYNNHQKSYWAGWLAAKSQAVPEGFVLVPVAVVKRCMSHISIATSHPNNTKQEELVMNDDMGFLEKAMLEATEGE